VEVCTALELVWQKIFVGTPVKEVTDEFCKTVMDLEWPPYG